MDSKWIRGELGQLADVALWRASWAESESQYAMVHQYFFDAIDVEAAHAKIFAWMNMPAHSLPDNARIIQENWCSSRLPGHFLPVWRVTWIENGEKHALFLFEPADHAEAVRCARRWARQRNETLEDFQMLSRLSGLLRYQAWFDPDEGRAVFAL